MPCKKDRIFYNKRTNESCSWSDLCCRLDLVLIFHLNLKPLGLWRQNIFSWVHYWPEGVGVLPLKLYQNSDLILVFFSVPLALVRRCRYQVWTFFHMFSLAHAKVAFCTLLTTHQHICADAEPGITADTLFQRRCKLETKNKKLKRGGRCGVYSWAIGWKINKREARELESAIFL